jgi:hypothetical protein
MNQLLNVTVLTFSTPPLYAQGAEPDTAKLKADAQKVVSIISRDKAKSQIYCQIADLDDQIDQENDRKKAEALVQKMNGLEEQLGPEYLALRTGLYKCNWTVQILVADSWSEWSCTIPCR